MIPTKQENPNGLHQRYRVTKADGTECDSRAAYFVLRLDNFGDDMEHVAACRAAAQAYAASVPLRLQLVANDLLKLVDDLESELEESP